MTREEEIINAATEVRMASAETLTSRGTHHSIDDMPFVDKMITYDEVAENAFIKGAEWADKNPNINSLWHTPDEPPEPKKRLIIHCDEKNEWNPIDQLVYYVDPEYPWDRTVKIYSILHWAYAEDLVPNFNEEF